MSDDKLHQDCNNLDKACGDRFGAENWTAVKQAYARGGGIPEQTMREVMKHGDPGQVLAAGAKERLLIEADEGNRESEIAYSQIRAKEREAWRRMKGRT